MLAFRIWNVSRRVFTRRSCGRGLLAFALVLQIALLGPGTLRAAEPRVNGTSGTEAVTAAEFVARCQMVMGLLDLPAQGSGSAVCIDRRGYFLTARHLVDSVQPGESVRIVLYVGTPQEKVAQARLLHLAEHDDLALLLVEGEKNLAAMPLADSAPPGESERIECVAFPFCWLLGRRQDSYPDCEVNDGKCIAPERGGGTTGLIHTDVQTDRGAAGGALLNLSGKLVGINAATDPALAATPVSRIRQFLAEPSVILSPLTIRYADRSVARPFEVEAIELASASEPLNLELELPGRGSEARVLPLSKDSHRFISAAAPLLPPDGGSTKLHLKARFKDASFSGDCDDRPVTAGSLSPRLSEVRRIERSGDAWILTRLDGTNFAVQRVVLGTFTSADGGKSQNLDQADMIDVFAYDIGPTDIACRINARRGGKLLVSQPCLVRLNDSPRPAPPKMRGAVAYWRFEQGSLDKRMRTMRHPTIIADESGNGNELRAYTLGTSPRFTDSVPAATVSATGAAIRRSLDFSEPPVGDGFNFRFAYLNHDGAGVDMDSHEFKQWTFETSVMFVDVSPVRQVFLACSLAKAPKAGNPSPRFELQKNGSNFELVVVPPSGSTVTLQANFPIEQRRWYHLAAIGDGKTAKLLIDRGDGQGYRTEAGGPLEQAALSVKSVNHSPALGIGGCGTAGDVPKSAFHGMLDEFRISDVALDPSELLFAPRNPQRPAAPSAVQP